MAYKRQIAYFDYMEYGEKKGNGGFCKWQQQNGMHTLEISISGLKENTSEKVKIFTKTGSELGDLQLHNGRAMAVFSKKGDDGNWDWEFAQIRIPLSEERELVAEFLVERNAQQLEEKVEEKNVQQSVEKTEEKNVQQHVEKVEEKNVQQPIEKIKEKNVQKYVKKVEESPLLQKIETIVKELAVKKEPEPDVRIEQERLMPDVRIVEEQLVNVRSEESKMPAAIQEEEYTPVSLWEWLEQTHEKMCPFGTREEYFRIMVEDIYRLKEECHVLRNNQFLLHGYYNYKYLILGKKGESSEEYWLGVPGIYHEREKMAARMYGFEKFEGAKRRYGVGDLGYYLITAK